MGKLRAVIYGIGAMGRLSAKLLMERGVRITGVIGHVNNIGLDLGEILGEQEPLGVVVSADADEVLKKAKADVAIMSVHEDISDSYVKLERCAKAGVNVLSLSDQLYYPWYCYAELAQKIDEVAKAHSVTITASGIQDVFWTNPVVVLSGASQKITSIEGVCVANMDDYGPMLATAYCIGDPGASFRKMTEEEATRSNLFTIALESIAAELDLTVNSWGQGLYPLIAENTVNSMAIGREIEPGQIMGAVTTSHVKTLEGIDLKGEMRLKVFEDSDIETSKWVIRGNPTLKQECIGLPGREAACTSVINRIPDILAAAPGLITVDMLPKPRYRKVLV